MKRIAGLRDVVTGGLCAGCGICASIAGPERIQMRLADTGQMRPAFLGELGAEEDARLVEVCPGATARGPVAEAMEPGTTLDTVWGPMRGLTRGWAADPEVRHRAAAGGALTALACFLFASRRVDAVVHVRASTTNPMLTDAHLSTTAEEAIQGARSRYGPSAPLVHVRRLLDEGSRFAVIAKPCDIAAIRNLAHQDLRVEQQVPYLLTIFCGGVPSSLTAEKIARYHGLTPDEVTLFRWRGQGWPGTTHVEATDGRSFDLTYEQTWFDDSAPWGYDVQWRCKICPDAIGELADVACPDGWLLDEAGEPMHEEAPGINVVLERTEAGSELVAAAIEGGYLRSAPLAREEFEAMHADHRKRKMGEPARLAALEETEAASPLVEDYRIEETRELAADSELLESQFDGAMRRIRAGQAEETLLAL
jgi:coenzyme F420 hydrogenase subunit beta